MEGLVDADTVNLCDRALGLFDDHAAGQRALQLLGQDLTATHGTLLEQTDGGHVSHGLNDARIGGVDLTGFGAEQVQRADDLVA
jgi:hypothetical protein